MDKHVKFGDTSYIFHANMSRMRIRFKCVCVSNTHDWNLQLTLRHLSSIVDYNSIDGHWWSPINIYLNERVVSWKFQPEYWRDYSESVFELQSDLVNWDGTVNVVQIQLSEVVISALLFYRSFFLLDHSTRENNCWPVLKFHVCRDGD